MRILALDTAIKTGCAFGVAGGKPVFWSVSLGEAEWSVRFSKMLELVDKCVDKYQPDLVAVEAAATGSHGNPDLIGLAACAQAQAARRGCQVVTYMPNSVRKHFMGKALTARDYPALNHRAAKKAIKSAVIGRCHMLGWAVTDDNQADAVALWDFAASKVSRAHQMTSLPGLFEGRA